MSTVRFLYSTAPDENTAKAIADSLVSEKLAACVNIFAPMLSVYAWNDQIERSTETPFIVKTTEQAAPAACARIIDEHPYETPCVASLPIDESGSSPAFLQWIAANCASGVVNDS